MKTKLNIMMLAFAAASVNLHAVPQALSAPLPQFMDKEQLTQWSASQSAAAKVASSSQNISTQFYTGKPYVADAGGYVFKYRTYNPEMSRWTSADPMGFPDGANSYRYYPNPLSSLDYAGCFDWVSGEAGFIGMETGELTYASSLTVMAAAVATIILDGPLGGSVATVAAAAATTGVTAMELGLVGINTGFGDTQTVISPGFAGNVVSSISTISSGLTSDIAVAQGAINPLQTLGNEALSQGNTPLANAYYLAFNVLSYAFILPEQTMLSTLAGERALIPVNDGSGDFE